MASTTSGSMTARVASAAPAVGNRRHRIDPESGRALEILGHAIEYLTDELVHSHGELEAHHGEILAVQLLMARNRQIYFACPVIPTLRERLQAFLHF